MSAHKAVAPENSTNISTVLSSPVKSSHNVAGHDRAEVAKKLISSRTTTVNVKEFFELLGTESKEVAGFRDKPTSSGDIIQYLNKLSNFIGEELSSDDRIHFLDSGNKSPDEHPTGTICRPDFVAIRLSPKAEPPSSKELKPKVINPPKSVKEGELTWSQLEATGEIYSKGQTIKTAEIQGVSYAGYHLQARPDLVSVIGIFVHFKLAQFLVHFTDAWGMYLTNLIDFKSKDTIPLLTACVRRLYHPETRPNIKRSGSFPGEHSFTIKVEGHAPFEGCNLLRVGLPSQRRSTIFTAPKNLIIKSQYVQTSRRFEEGPILRRIHESGDFPGIVRLVPAAIVKADATEQKSSKEEETTSKMEEALAVNANRQYKHRDMQMRETLLVLQDKASLLVDAETPLEALIAFYDLLEVTRFLFEYRKILHRDISVGNVLLREKGWVSKTSFGNEFERMCFATHLLGEKGPDAKASRLYTRVLLIDFDMAEDRGTGSGEPSSERSGTSVTMARLVRNPMVRENIYNLRAMPQFTTEFALESYKACVGDRVKEFPKNDKGSYEIEVDKKVPYSHRLSYDAESILWLLFLWVVQIQPLKKQPENLIPGSLWTDLTGGEGAEDPRVGLVYSFREGTCHPVYQELERLVRLLLQQLKGYQEQVAQPFDKQDPSRKKGDYLSEAFQRLILDFIVKNIDGSFMREQISPTRRPWARGGEMSQLSKTSPVYTSGAKRDREEMEGREEQPSGGPAAKKVKGDISTN